MTSRDLNDLSLAGLIKYDIDSEVHEDLSLLNPQEYMHAYAEINALIREPVDELSRVELLASIARIERELNTNDQNYNTRELSWMHLYRAELYAEYWKQQRDHLADAHWVLLQKEEYDE